jgi:hypothetical protein
MCGAALTAPCMLTPDTVVVAAGVVCVPVCLGLWHRRIRLSRLRSPRLLATRKSSDTAALQVGARQQQLGGRRPGLVPDKVQCKGLRNLVPLVSKQLPLRLTSAGCRQSQQGRINAPASQSTSDRLPQPSPMQPGQHSHLKQASPAPNLDLTTAAPTARPPAAAPAAHWGAWQGQLPGTRSPACAVHLGRHVVQ